MSRHTLPELYTRQRTGRIYWSERMNLWVKSLGGIMVMICDFNPSHEEEA